MNVYVDTPTRFPNSGFKETNARIKRGLWSHCWADSEEELDQFSRRVGLPLLWLMKTEGKKGMIFAYVSPTMQQVCIQYGARLIDFELWKLERKLKK